MHICDTYHWDYLLHNIYRFYSNDFQLNTDCRSKFCILCRKTTWRLLKDRFLKTMLLIRAKTRRFFISAKLPARITLLFLLKSISGFEDSEVPEFKVAVHYGLWGKTYLFNKFYYCSRCPDVDSSLEAEVQ